MPRTKQSTTTSSLLVDFTSVDNNSSSAPPPPSELLFQQQFFLGTPIKRELFHSSDLEDHDDERSSEATAEALLLLGGGGGRSNSKSSPSSDSSSVVHQQQLLLSQQQLHPHTPTGQGIQRRTPKKPDAKRKLDLEPKKTRIDSSLSALTKRFVTLIPEGGSLDLNSAARALQVQKRRIYDITNVLEGIGVLTKKSKNNIQWSDKLSNNGGDNQQQHLGVPGGGGGSRRLSLEHEINVLEKREGEVDGYIRMVEQGLKVIQEDKRWGYLTHADIRSISGYKDRTLLLIKAPPSTAVTVPPPNEGLAMHMKSVGGEIGVYLCPEDDGTSSTLSTPTSSPLKRNPSSAAADLLHHHHHHQEEQQDDPATTTTSNPQQQPLGFSLLELEESDYNFTLGPDEGVAHLFLGTGGGSSTSAATAAASPGGGDDLLFVI